MGRMIIFGLVMSSVWLWTHYYIGRQLLSGVGWDRKQRRVAWIAIWTIGSLVPIAMIAGRLVGLEVATAIMWPAYSYMGFYILLLTFSLLRSAVMGIVRLVDQLRGVKKGTAPLGPVDPTKRRLFTNATSLGVLGLSGGLAGVGYREARRLAEIVEVSVPIKDLPANLEGFKIVQVSDIHVGQTIRKPYLDAVIDAVNAQSPDMVAITGDLVDGFVEDMREEMTSLSRIKARHGSFYVTGNHEFYWDAQAWEEEVARLGVNVLHNRHEVIEHEGERVIVAGITDYSAGRFGVETSPKKALEGAPDGVKILLAHQPKSIKATAETSANLQLSGHTHGGQFFPINLFVGFAHPFTAGLHSLTEQLQIYVSRGTGYWGPPMRLGAASEITVLRLVKA